MKDVILRTCVPILSFTRLFTTTNAMNPTTSAQNHSRKRNVSPLTIVFEEVSPHKFDIFLVSKNVETKLVADVPTMKPRKCPLNCLYAYFDRSFELGHAIVSIPNALHPTLGTIFDRRRFMPRRLWRCPRRWPAFLPSSRDPSGAWLWLAGECRRRDRGTWLRASHPSSGS